MIWLIDNSDLIAEVGNPGSGFSRRRFHNRDKARSILIEGVRGFLPPPPSYPKAFHHLIGRLCFTSHRQRGHLGTAPPFTLPLHL